MTYTTLIQPAILIAMVLIAGRYAFKKRWKRAGLALLIGALTAATLVVTPAGHRGVVYSARGGVSMAERQPGFSFIVPGFQSVAQMDVRSQKFFTDKAFSQSSDLQEITVHVAVNYHLDPNEAAKIFDDVGKDYERILILPAVQQLVKAEVGLIKAEAFAQERSTLADSMLVGLTERLTPLGIVIEFVAIEDAIFQEAFVLSVQAKIVAEQKAQEALNLVLKAKHDADAVVKTATGRAEAIRLEADAQAEANAAIAASLDQNLLTWQRVIRWNGVVPETLLQGDGTSFIVDLP